VTSKEPWAKAAAASTNKQAAATRTETEAARPSPRRAGRTTSRARADAATTSVTKSAANWTCASVNDSGVVTG
jgi:hypothetical protein